MKISHSFTVHISDKTYITNYSNGDRHLCSFFEDTETVTLSFSIDSLQNLTETIQNLQQIYQSLCQQRQQQISKELELINSKTLVLSTHNGNGKNHAEAKLDF